MGCRNLLFNSSVFKSYSSPLRTICIGNLSAGGTGKTPFLAYLHHVLKERNLEIATLSRGYGRKTTGFLIANEDSTSQQIGDEPLQLYQDFGQQSTITVCEKRVNGMQEIEKIVPKETIVLLDDAYQHRWVKSGFTVLLSTFQDPFFSDFVLPTGNLREFRFGAKRADVIVITKCDSNLSEVIKNDFTTKLKKYNRPVFFSTIAYQKLKPMTSKQVENPKNILLVSAIGNAKPLIAQLEKSATVTHIKFADHHTFTNVDMNHIHEKYSTFDPQNTIIVCTQKDAVKLEESPLKESIQNYPWYCQNIEIQIDNELEFKKLIYKYVDSI